MAELFLNLICEEIPARMQKNAAADLERLFVSALTEAGLAPSGAKTFYGPRHLAISLDHILDRQPDLEIEKRGPRTDAPDKAIEGFCKSVGLSRDELVTEDSAKGTFYFARQTQKGAAVAEILPTIVTEMLAHFPWPKSQRWGTSRLSWVRPLHGINLLLDGALVPGELDLGGEMAITFDTTAYGHPFYAKDGFTITSVADWQTKMQAAFVMTEADVKSQTILADAQAKTAAAGLELIPDDGLLAEVTGLVEWPNAILGTIDDSFMALPEEVLITSMRVHQKYFATRYASGDKAGQIAPYFVTVANRKSDATNDALITHGNERVLRARLADAAFFWDQDKGTDLNDYIPSLAQVTFYEGLGSVGDKVTRMTALSAAIASHVPGADAGKAQQAATLAKADLVTGMVGEFPELQGIMGGYYAAHHGYEADIVAAISDHYRPAGPSDRVPATPEGLVVSLADKIDTLVGFFGIGAKPTGSKDPFALRRAALAILRMIDEANLRLPLEELLQQAATLYGFAALDGDVTSFIQDRLRVMLRDTGLSHDVIAAALTAQSVADPKLLMDKVHKLEAALQTEAGEKLIAGYKRAANILAAEAKKNTSYPDSFDANLCQEPAEIALGEALGALPESRLETAADIDARLTALSGLAPVINRFFEEIIVNAEDATVRGNRLALVHHLTSVMTAFADFSKIEK